MTREQIQYLKFDLMNGLELVQNLLLEGKVMQANNVVTQLKRKRWKIFPFKYGSEITKGYKDEDILR